MAMTILSKLALTLGTSSLLATSLSAQKTELKFHPIPLKVTDKGVLFSMPTEVEGKKVNFLVDTGSTQAVVFSKALAESLKKKLTPVGKAQGVGKATQAFKASFKDVKLGGAMAVKADDNFVIPLKNLSHLTIGGAKADFAGIVGAPLMKQVRGILDYGSNQFLVPLAPKGPQGYTAAMKSNGMLITKLQEGKAGYPYIIVTLKDKKYAFLIDSGANANTINASVAKELGLKVEGPGRTINGTGKQKGVQTVKVENVLLGSKIRLNAIKCLVMPDQGKLSSVGDIKAGGIIGSGVMKQLKAKIDFETYNLVVPPAKKK